MDETTSDLQTEAQLDPIYVSSLRELRWILVTWLVSFVWVIGYCWLFGYGVDEQGLATTLGMPSWAFWGVFVPWVVTAVVTCWFAIAVMKDHPLDDAELNPANPDQGFGDD